MHSAKSRLPTDQEVDVAWQLFLALRDDPSVAAAENLIDWLREKPRHVRALNEVLTVWALTGAAMISSRDILPGSEVPLQ